MNLRFIRFMGRIASDRVVVTDRPSYNGSFIKQTISDIGYEAT
jgi:hypothetical protein